MVSCEINDATWVDYSNTKWTKTSRLVGYSLPTPGCTRGMLPHVLQVYNDEIRQSVNLHCVYISYKLSTRNPLKWFWRTWNIYARIRQWIILYDTMSTWCNITGLQIIMLQFFTIAFTFLALLSWFFPLFFLWANLPIFSQNPPILSKIPPN
jgi:hypothetical protein